ncbi:MAG: isopeptide-forming domain-containing fimbrial protein [Finegoldia magna]|uniref:isopeptide-forming domain-containing fimbrial protein n=1 Tax=Finegoldia magna TaxID=1260 RepID=UPI0026EDC94A|nr:isopeptide-forming domain-containing fimbrial protein [Finegoldia magna]MBS5966785.1 isopeptide-forming domain-containing fimbrial protein [Finegoldia magna]
MKKRFLSLIIALAMMVGVFTPLLTSAEGEHKTDVVIHKMELKDLTGWPKDAGAEGADKTKYDGSKLDPKYFGTDAKELDKVKFYVFKITEENYNTMKKSSSDYATKDDVTTKITNAELIKNGDKDYFETTTDGAKVEGLVDGYYWIVEDKDSVSRDGRTFAGAAAVPFGLALPYAKADGKPFGQGADALHVYPKNTLADKPIVDKDFKGKANPEKPRSAEEKNVPESHDAGDIIEYEIKTVFQPNTQYKTAFWTDQMTEGLTFNQDSIRVAVGDADLTADTDYTVDTTTTNTFRVTLTQEGLKKVNNQPKAVTVTVSYTATLNDKAKVDIPESNDVVFHYGNNPSQGNTPVPNKPKDQKMKVTKTWAEGTAPTGVTAKVALYDANTGEKVGETITLPNNGSWEYEWTDLDDNKNYKVVEEGIDGYDAEYTKGEAGNLTITNHKTNNPKPLNPDEPKVVTYGKKFVKMEKGSDTVRLQGAKFVIKNAEGKFLGSTASQATEEKTAYETAQKAYVEALNSYNAEVAKENPTGLDTLKATLTEKKKARDDAFTKYVKAQNKWITAKDAAEAVTKGALVLTSDEQGRFEIKGLAEGKDYKLVETEAPKGYAEIKDEIGFTVGKGTYAGTDKEIQYNKDDTNAGYGQRVDNTKLTIPQTGGIGTIIFTAIGLAIMASAIIAIKKRQATEAR